MRTRSYPPNVAERRALIDRSLLRKPCKSCKRAAKPNATMSSLRCVGCQSSLRQRWQVQRTFEEWCGRLFDVITTLEDKV